MKHFPEISVIVTTFNRCDYLKSTINCILNQTYKDFELIIVSDGSTDSTKQFVTSLNDKRILFYESEKNSGLPAISRNIGIKLSNGKFIAFCDDDDLWDINKLELQYKNIESSDFCFTKRMFINENDVPLNINIGYFPNFLFKTTLFFTNYITLSSVIVRKDLLQSLNGFNENYKFKAVEDYDLWLRLFLLGIKISFCDEKLVKYRIHQNNISSNKIINSLGVLNIFKNLYLSNKINLFTFLFLYFVGCMRVLFNYLLLVIR